MLFFVGFNPFYTRADSYFIFFLSFCISAYCSHKYLADKIILGFSKSCNSSATFDYMILKDPPSRLENCSVHYDIQDLHTSFPGDKQYKYLEASGTITVGQLDVSQNYTLQVKCGDIESDVVNFSADSK